MGHDDDRHFARQLHDGLLNSAGRCGVERRTRLIHEQNARLYRQRTGNAETLLLTAGEPAARLAEAVLGLVPQAGFCQALFNEFFTFRLGELDARERQSGRHVVLDAHGREGIGLLKDHADVSSRLGDSTTGVVDVFAIEIHLTSEFGARHKFVHAVEGAQERRLSATGRPDEGCHLILRHHEGNLIKHLSTAKPGRYGARVEGRLDHRTALDCARAARNRWPSLTRRRSGLRVAAGCRRLGRGHELSPK